MEKIYKPLVLDGGELRAYQLAILQMAKDLVEFFDEYNIKYSLSGGSILGAIRHQGFIPWDDDIDLNMPRHDYQIMVENFDKELGEHYYLQTPEKNPELGLMVVQVRKKGTVARRKYDWQAKECGISLDIYIMENVYDNPLLRWLQKEMCMIMAFAVSTVRYCKNSSLPVEIQELEHREINYKKSKQVLGIILKIIPLRKWVLWSSKIFSICKNDKSKMVAIPSGRKHFAGEQYKRKDMCVFEKTAFEDTFFNIPVWAKGYLKMFYGDYMQIPPPEKREQHSFLELDY